MQLADIQHLALLARIEVSEEEQLALLSDLTATLAYVDQVTRAVVSGSETGVPEHRNVLREDIVTTVTGSYTDILMKEVPEKEGGYVKVKKIL